jgi:hypothetical protein
MVHHTADYRWNRYVSVTCVSMLHFAYDPFTVEILGYMGRTLQHNHIWARGPLVVQTLFILIAPAFFTASIYIVFGRIIQLIDGERYSVVQKKLLVKMFVSTDALGFVLQAIGRAPSNCKLLTGS